MDLYSLLNVASDATSEQISAAYRKLSLKHHPDKHHHQSHEKRAEQAEKFKLITEARDILLDPVLKSIYDSEGLDAVKTAQQMFPNIKCQVKMTMHEFYNRTAISVKYSSLSADGTMQPTELSIPIISGRRPALNPDDPICASDKGHYDSKTGQYGDLMIELVLTDKDDYQVDIQQSGDIVKEYKVTRLQEMFYGINLTFKHLDNRCYNVSLTGPLSLKPKVMVYKNMGLKRPDGQRTNLLIAFVCPEDFFQTMPKEEIDKLNLERSAGGSSDGSATSLSGIDMDVYRQEQMKNMGMGMGMGSHHGHPVFIQQQSCNQQ